MENNSNVEAPLNNDSASTDNRLPQSEWEKLRETTFERDEHSCVNCDSTNRLEVHHIVPVSAEGNHCLSNLVTLCKSCHLASENKRERNDHAAIKSQKTYQHLQTPDEVRLILQKTRHPVARILVILHSYYGIGVSEICGMRISDYTTSNPRVAAEFGIEHSDSPTLTIAPDREYTSTRSRVQVTTLPLIPAVEAELIAALSIRPDPQPDHDELLLNTISQWGKPLSRDAAVHQLHKQTDTRAEGFINCFKQYAPIDQYTKRYLLSGDPDELDNALTTAETNTNPETFVRSRYRENIYDLLNTSD